MLTTVEEIVEVRTHPNADSLDIAQVLGYECIVRRGSHSTGEHVVFIQPDALLPVEKPWAAELLKYTSRNRVKAARLRGEWSMGIIMPTSILEGHPFSLSDEVSEILGVTKYEPLAPKNIQAKASVLPFGIPKTDENRWQNLRNVPWGAPVDVTLKIDGSSFTVYCALPDHFPVEEPTTGLCSRSLELKLLADGEGTNPWLDAARMTGAMDLLQAYCVKHGVSLALRGEVYGQGVQSLGCNPHCRRPRGVAFFSVWDMAGRRYCGREDPHYFVPVCAALGLPTVPLLEVGVEFSRDLVERYGDNMGRLDGEMFEGVVLKGRNFSLKVVNKAYDAKK